MVGSRQDIGNNMRNIGRSSNRTTVLPTALVIGPMKAGTSWIQRYLASRTDICLPYGVKETFFFDKNYGKGIEWYRWHFCACNGRKLCAVIEVAPTYFHSVAAPARIRECLGDIPLVVTLRDPVERAWSHYLHLRRKGYTRSTLKAAVEAYPEIVQASQYEECLARWTSVFRRELLTEVWLEELARSPDEYVRSICGGLCIPYASPPGDVYGADNAATHPHSARLASLSTRIANFLRARRLYWIVNLGKTLGLKGLAYGRIADPLSGALSEADYHWLKERIDDKV